MILSLKEKDFGEARYIIMKEIETVSPIGKILIDRDSRIFEIMDLITYNMEKSYHPEEGGIAAFELPDPHFLNSLIYITETFPSLILQDLHINWDDFASAWLTIMANYCKILEEKIALEFNPETVQLYQDLNHHLDQAIESIIRLFEIGITYIDLINSSRGLVEEMKSWGEARPTSLKLSEAYLNALKFYD